MIIVRSYVETAYEGDPSLVPTVDFDFVLSASKDAFVQMRYVYERGIAPDTGWLADTIVDGARKVIFEKHPEWARMQQTSPVPEAFSYVGPPIPERA